MQLLKNWGSRFVNFWHRKWDDLGARGGKDAANTPGPKSAFFQRDLKLQKFFNDVKEQGKINEIS